MNRFNLLLLILLVQCFGCTGDTSSVTQGDTSATESELTMESASKKDSPPEASATTTSPIDDDVHKDAMTLYREAQAMMKDGKLNAGYETAEKAMAQFIEEADDLAWMMLESIAVEDKRIEVHFNMGQRERNMPKDGIVRPLSFRIWSKDNSELLQILDFEIARSGGQSVTAALGEMTDTGHTNYGILDVDADYETIRQRVVDLIAGE